MKIFRFLCRLRGYHVGYFHVNDFNQEKQQSIGDVAPCQTCGLTAGNGTLPDSRILLRWWRDPE